MLVLNLPWPTQEQQNRDSRDESATSSTGGDLFLVIDRVEHRKSFLPWMRYEHIGNLFHGGRSHIDDISAVRI